MKTTSLSTLAIVTSLLALTGCMAADTDSSEEDIQNIDSAATATVGQAVTVIGASNATVVAPMSLKTEAGHTFVHNTQQDTSGQGQGSATFTFNVQTAGTYDIALTIEAFKPSYNSFYVKVDQEASAARDFEATNGYQKYAFGTRTFSAGTHTITFRGKALWARLESIELSYKKPVLGPTGYTKPKRAIVDYTWTRSDAQAARLAKYDIALIDKGRPAGAAAVNAFAAAVKSKNPKIRVGHYTMFMEIPCSLVDVNPSLQPFWGPVIDHVNQADFWLHKADGTKAQWTTQYHACDINFTKWGTKDANGKTWGQYKWELDRQSYFTANSSLDYVFMDNIFVHGRTTADYKRNHTNQSPTDPEIVSAWREGYNAIWNTIHATNPNLKIIGNTDADLSVPEFQQKMEGGLLEAIMAENISWATEKLTGPSGWGKAMDWYHNAMKNTKAPHDVVLYVYGSKGNYRLMRYGLATTMLDDGFFAYQQASDVTDAWYDEYDANIGYPIEVPPMAATQNGIWSRKFSNGIVLVNPSPTATASINVGAGYKRLSGTQDPAVNNGKAESTVTLGPRQGLLMIKQ